MKLARKFSLVAMMVTCVVAGVLLIAGCGDMATAPLTPDDNGNDLGGLHYADSVFSELQVAPDGPGGPSPANVVLKVDEDVAEIGKNGGRLILALADGPSSLDIPERALNKTVIISALGAQLSTPWGTVTLFDFSPDGLRFKKPATLTVTVNAPNGTVLSLYWFNPKKGKWELEMQAAVLGNKIHFEINHFSKYGIN